MAERLIVNRDELQRVFQNHETVIQFENLFAIVDEYQSSDTDSSIVVSQSALAKADAALSQLKYFLRRAFETLNSNLEDWDKTFTYTGLRADVINYTKGGKTITKTYNYTGPQLTSVVFSGDTPARIKLTKTLSYTGLKLTGVSYS